MIINIIIFFIIIFFIYLLININKLDIITLIYIMAIAYLLFNTLCQQEFFDNFMFNGIKYINSIDNIDNNEIVNNEIDNNSFDNNNNNYNLNLDMVKKEINKDNKLIIFNSSNRPIEKEIKTYNDIKDMVLIIINLMKQNNNNLYLRNVININQEKIDNQAKLSFNIIFDNNKDINLNIYVELLFEKLYENQEVFKNNNDNLFKTYLNKLEFK